ERKMPRYAGQTFRQWFAERQQPELSKREKVLLWVDTFNNHFYPQTLQATTRVLEDAGFEVLIPEQNACCALPLFAEGMLDQARDLLRRTLDSVQRAVDEELPVVGLEPSCIASLRDEVAELLLYDSRAHYLAQNSFLLSEFLLEQNYQPPAL